MEKPPSFETFVAIYRTTRCHIPEDYSLNVQCHEKQSFHLLVIYVLALQ